MVRFPLGPRHTLLFVFAASTLALTVAGALASTTLLSSSLDRAAEQDADREARVVTDMGLADALDHGRLSRGDLQLAASQYTAARRDLPLTGVVIWLPPGDAIFARGSGRADAVHPVSHIVVAALRTGTAQVANATDPHAGSVLEAAVPLGRRALGAVVEFHFARGGVQRNLGEAKHSLYALAAVGAAIMYLAILPLLARLVQHVPLAADPFRRAALAELRLALSRDELLVHYQPKVDASSGATVGVEALVRWNHPKRGLLGPLEFLPLAESTPDLLAALTFAVLDRAVRDCTGWRAAGYELPVAVNVAPSVLLGGSLAVQLQEAMRRHDIDPSLLTIELTESALMEPEEDLTEHLRDLRALGVSLSIDDFGTGNSSLARLRSLPLDELKVDRSFITGISTDERDLGITRHIVQLGQELGLRVVAEGVEDERTLRRLRLIGCEVVQGYHLARPMPEVQLRAWLARRPICRSASAPVGPAGGADC